MTDREFEEATQLALALSLSEGETRLGPANQIQTSTADDAALARKLQEEYDRELEGERAVISRSRPAPQAPPGGTTAPDLANACAGCGGPLQPFPGFLGSLMGGTEYIAALNRRWHPRCYVCKGCRQPLRGGCVTPNGKDPYHRHCHRQLHHPRCTVCSEFLPDQPGGRIVFHVAPFWLDKSCPAHATDGTRRCTACNRLQPRNQWWPELDDGRALCLQCLDTVVADTAAAQPLYDDVLNFFDIHGMPLPVRPPLILVDDSALNEASAYNGPRRNGPVFHTRGLCLTEYSQTFVKHMSPFGLWGLRGEPNPVGPPRCEVTAILVLQGLPRQLTGSILAHESMHAWLRLNGYRQLSAEIEEGLCQLMALLWLERHGDANGAPKRLSKSGDPEYESRLGSFLGHQIRSDPSPVYGEGLRAALDAFQRVGLGAVLAHVGQTGGLP